MEAIISQELKDILCPISGEILPIFMTIIESYSGGINVKNLRKELPPFCSKSLEQKYLDYLIVFYVFRLHEVPKDLAGISFDEIAGLLLENPIRKRLNKLHQNLFEKIYYIVIFLRISNINLGEISNICRALITFVSRELCTSQTGGKVNGLIVWVRDIFRLIFNKPKNIRVIHNSSGKKRSRELDDAVTGLLSISEEQKDCRVIVLEEQEGNSSIKLW